MAANRGGRCRPFAERDSTPLRTAVVGCDNRSVRLVGRSMNEDSAGAFKLNGTLFSITV
jgi:hypothetical protein